MNKNKYGIFFSSKGFFIALVVLFFILNNVGNIYDLLVKSPNSYERVLYDLNSENDKYLLYIDSSCDVSYFEAYQQLKYVENRYESQIFLDYYNSVTNKIECANRLAKSNGYALKIENNSSQKIAIGVGIVEDIENIKRSVSFNILFLFVSFLYSRKNFKVKIYNFWKVNFLGLLFSLIIFLLLGNTLVFWLTSIVVPLLILINIINIIFSSVEKDVFIKSLVTVSCFALPFYHSTISFYSGVFVVLLASKNKNVIKDLLFSLLLILPLIISFIFNFKNFTFLKPSNYDYSIYTQPGFFNQSIVNQNEGYKLLIIVINLYALIFMLIVVRKLMLNQKLGSIEIMKSFLNGFVIWSFISFLSEMSYFLHFQLLNFFGLSDIVDPSYRFMWSGVNFGYEMTSFWFLSLLVISTYLVIEHKNYIYILHIIVLFLFTNINGSRTAIILYIVSLPIIFLMSRKKDSKKLFLVISAAFIILNLIFPRTFERVLNKTTDLNCSQVLSSQLRSTDDRTDYDIKISNYNLTFEDVLNETTNLNSLSKKLLTLTSCALSRQVEWARFFIISDLEGIEKLFGKGYGNSYEKLVFEMEKPHSLYFSLYYQIGLFGLLYYMIIFSSSIYKMLTSREKEKLIVCLFIVLVLVNGLKTNFLFTFWGTTFTFFSISLLLPRNK